jgi:hypothetical protein
MTEGDTRSWQPETAAGSCRPGKIIVFEDFTHLHDRGLFLSGARIPEPEMVLRPVITGDPQLPRNPPVQAPKPCGGAKQRPLAAEQRINFQALLEQIGAI